MEEAHNLNCISLLLSRQYKNHIQFSIPKIVSGIGTEKNQMAKKVRVSCLMVSSLWVGPSALLEIEKSIRDPTIHGSNLMDAGTVLNTPPEAKRNFDCSWFTLQISKQ